MKFNTTTLTKFNEHFFRPVSADFHFYGKKVVYPNIRQGVNAEIILSIHGTMGQYEGYLVKIVHKEKGEVTSEFFAFKDYLVEEKPMKENPYGLVIIEHCGSDWYMSSPTRLSHLNMVTKILGYINDYR